MNPESPTQSMLVPDLPDYEMLRCIGTGTFGDVWLARARATQRFRAIKLLCRNRFPRDRPYEIEFAGMKKYEAISREHEGFIDILHVSRNDALGCFSYVMELADDVENGQSFEPENYIPKTLASELSRRQMAAGGDAGRFTPAECARIGVDIAAALGALHGHGLVHRDIKPSNIVFVRGTAKLADVGLVTEVRPQGKSDTLIGSPPYMDRLAHGTVQGDLYGFGKVLYVMACGRDPMDWPELPGGSSQWEHSETLRELMEISRKACHEDRSQRYTNAGEIHQALLLLRVGQSVKRLQRLERLVRSIKRYGLAAAGLLLVAGLLLYQGMEQRKQAAELLQRKVGSCVAYGTRAVEENDLLGALPWYAEALRLDVGNPRAEWEHRLRLGMALRQCPNIVQMWFTDPPLEFARFVGQDNQVVLSMQDRRWAVHDLATGRRLYPPFGRGGKVESMAICPAFHSAVTTEADRSNNVVRIWDYMTGQELGILVHASPVGQVAISADGQWVAASAIRGSNDFPAIIWDSKTRQSTMELAGHGRAINCLAFSPDGRRLATGGSDNQVIVWDLTSGKPLVTFTNHTNWIYSVAFSPDGSRLASASFDRTVRVWDATSGRESVPFLAHDDGIRSVEFSADGGRLVTAGLDFLVRIWDAQTGRLRQRLRHNAKPMYAAFSPGGRHIVTACWDGTGRVWDMNPARFVPEASAVDYSGDGAWLALATNQIIQVYSASRNQTSSAALPLGQASLRRCYFNRDGSRLLVLSAPVAGGSSNRVRAVLWDARLGKPVGQARRLDDLDCFLGLSPVGDRVAIVDGTRTVVWDFLEGNERLILPQAAQRATFDPTGLKLAAAISNQVEVWQFAGAPARLFPPFPMDAFVGSVEWSGDGRHLVTGCWDSSFQPEYAQVWDAATGSPIGAPLKHLDGVRFAAFSPDGRRVITCSEDVTAQLWDWRLGRPAVPPLRHKHQVFHAAFSPDGRWLATAGRDCTARVWDAETGEPITQDLPHPEAVIQVQWVDQGRSLLTRTKSGQTRQWHLTPDARPWTKLVKIAELLSAEQIHPSGAVQPQTRAAMQKLWEELRHGPDGFSWPGE